MSDEKAAKPVYEFRPLPDAFDRWHAAILRYAAGEWVPDDGEYDVAFVVPGLCLYVDIGYQKNIEWSWLTTHWRGYQASHPRGNPWHYSLAPGETKWGGNWGRDRHPNSLAGRKGMDKALSLQGGSASGRHVEFHLNDRHMNAGLVRDCDTKEIVRVPKEPLCMYCGHDWLEVAAIAKAATT